jgi:hypothetical protein
MMITRGDLLDTSIAQLETLAAFLGDQLGYSSDRLEPATSEARACQDTLLSLSVLIVRLQAARHTTPGSQMIAEHEGCEVSQTEPLGIASGEGEHSAPTATSSERS